MLQGVRFKANPTLAQKCTLSQWMGCSRSIWNAKCQEERYYSTFARKYYPIGTYAPIDQKTSQLKNKELTPWLYDCPSQIIRNTATNWYQTFQGFIKGRNGKPKLKAKSDRGSIHLTRELFHFDRCDEGVLRLFVGTKTNNIGYLSFKKHREFEIPKSIYVKKEFGQYYVSFCYEDGMEGLGSNKDHLNWLKGATFGELNDMTIGIDRGVAIPVQAGDLSFDFAPEQKRSKVKKIRKNKRLQRQLARQIKGSKRRQKTKLRIGKNHTKVANVRRDFCHKTSRALVNSPSKVFIFEDLKIVNMTRRPKPKQDENGKFVSNKAAQKAGLNKAILNQGWHQMELFTTYKAQRSGKAVFRVAANHTSQECADCGHIHPDNRRSQALFECVYCGHIDNADRNASLVIKKRAINLMLDSGTELSDRGVLRPAGTGRGAKNKPPAGENSVGAVGNEASKKKELGTLKRAA